MQIMLGSVANHIAKYFCFTPKDGFVETRCIIMIKRGEGWVCGWLSIVETTILCASFSNANYTSQYTGLNISKSNIFSREIN